MYSYHRTTGTHNPTNTEPSHCKATSPSYLYHGIHLSCISRIHQTPFSRPSANTFGVYRALSLLHGLCVSTHRAGTKACNFHCTPFLFLMFASCSILNRCRCHASQSIDVMNKMPRAKRERCNMGLMSMPLHSRGILSSIHFILICQLHFATVVFPSKPQPS